MNAPSMRLSPHYAGNGPQIYLMRKNLDVRRDRRNYHAGQGIKDSILSRDYKYEISRPDAGGRVLDPRHAGLDRSCW